MKIRLTVVGCALAALMGWAAAPVQAQSAPGAAMSVLPPPAINDPGVVPVVPTKAAASGSPKGHAAVDPIMHMPLPELPGDTPRDANGNPPPTVEVTRHDGTLIEQYYRGGALYMVHVKPEHGLPYSYLVDKNHTLHREPGAPPVNPVLFTILKWGQPASDSGDGSH